MSENQKHLVLASHQPDFFPWMGYFYKIFQSDIFVFSDNVQYSKTGMHNYNYILTNNGKLRVTLPIHYHVANLNELYIAEDFSWIRKTLKTLEMEYSKAAHFEEAYPVIEDLITSCNDLNDLATFNTLCIIRLCMLFGLGEKGRLFQMSSDLDLKNRKDARIIEMCKRFNADTYYSGAGAKDYHIEEDYAKNGIKLVYSDYKPVIYPQVAKAPALNMSVIDYVMNCGFELPKEWKRLYE